jgi:hypothetical protein
VTLLIVSIGATLLVPQSSAHTPPWEIKTYAYVVASPNPIGVNQQVAILMWLDKIPNAAVASNDIRFHDYNLTVVAPDGSAETTIFDVVQDTTSSQGYYFTPDQIGTYTLYFSFPGQVYTWDDPVAQYYGPPLPNEYTNDTYLPSNATATLTVQEEQITAIDTYPLPSEYWTRPIFGENPGWWTISSNWLGTGSPEFTSLGFGANRVVSGAVGSETAHIMWTKPIQSGGVVGDDNFITAGDTYFEGTAYLNRYTNPIIMDGKLFYTEPLGYSQTTGGPTKCVDLRTGEEIWSSTSVPSPSFGYIYSYQDMNYHGVWPPILIASGGGYGSSLPSGMWLGYDADTGRWLFNATNVPSGTKAMGPQGEYLQYVIANAGNTTNPDYRLCQWNSSKLGTYGVTMSNGAILGTVDASKATCYDWNKTISWRNTMTSALTPVIAYAGDMMLCYNGSLPNGGSPAAFGRAPSSAPYTYFAINLNESKGTVGSILWWETLNAPPGNVTVFITGIDQQTNVFVEYYKETMQWVGYNLRTGDKMWGPTDSQCALDYYGSDFGGIMTGQLAYGNLYSCGFGGVMYCYDLETGNLLWTYGNGGEGNSTNAGLQTGQGTYPTDIYAVGNGVIYTITIEHTFTTPIYKGALTRAINATDGTEIWTLPCVGSGWSYAIADGYSNFYNGYDNRIYVTGRGPSQTTVNAPLAAINLGGSLVINGRVTDIAAGTKSDEQASRFPNGVPCASDESMTDWMSYVYQQRPLPTDFTGVDVTISIIDSNGNFREIGTAKTDASGTYSLQWTPDIEGQYTVIAQFAGTKGYWPSYSETSFAVDPAGPTPSPYPTISYPPLELYFVASTIAIIIAIAIVGFLLAKKRP